MPHSHRPQIATLAHSVRHWMQGGTISLSSALEHYRTRWNLTPAEVRQIRYLVQITEDSTHELSNR